MDMKSTALSFNATSNGFTHTHSTNSEIKSEQKNTASADVIQTLLSYFRS